MATAGASTEALAGTTDGAGAGDITVKSKVEFSVEFSVEFTVEFCEFTLK